MKKHTVCRLCSSCCPVEVHVEENRLIAAERLSSLPAGQRVPCPKLQAAPEITHSPLRILKPLVRDEKGRSGGFREASWDEALDIVADQFLQFKERFGPESVCWLRGMAADWGAPWDYANRLMNAFGSPNTVGNGSVCHVAREMAHNYTYGAMTVPQAKDARCILVWGKNDRNTNPGAFEAILQARRQGTKLIVVDPVKTGLAAMADLWLQVKPGHDGLLAMSMIHEIIASEAYDRDFVANWTTGFRELRKAAETFAPARVASDLWLDPRDIREAAGVYASTRPACIIDGNGLDMQVNTFQATRAVCILRAITGNLDKPGGDFIPQPVPVRNLQLKERLPAGLQPVTSRYPLFNAFHPTWGLHAQSCVVDAILEEKPYPLRMLVVQSGNPAVTMTDSNRVRKALQKLQFLVVIDLFHTRTTRFADVVLPAAGCFEKTQLNRASMRNNLVILQDRVMDCLGESRPDWEIMFQLARRLGLHGEFPWETVEEAIDYQLEPSGITVAMLRERPSGIAAMEIAFEKYREQGFATPSRKVEILSERLRDHGLDAVPYMSGWAGNPISFSDRRHEYPFIGMSGARSNRFTHTQFHTVEALLKMEPGGFVDIHPEDAAGKGITEGDRVRVETPKGEVCMRARISGAVHPGSLRVAWGWGDVDPEADLNCLTDDEKRDVVTGTPSARTFMCRLEKAGT